MIILIVSYVINQLKIRSKKKPFNSQYQKFLNLSIIFRYSVTNPDFLQMENKLKNYVLDNKKFAFYQIICKWNYTFRILSLVLSLIRGIVFLQVSI